MNNDEVNDEGTQECVPSPVSEAEVPPAPVVPRWRPASEPTCCGSSCDDCPF
jgi:hypothetical protein